MELFRRYQAGHSDLVARELRALEAERDAELYYESLQHLAGRLARRDRLAEAGEIYAFVAEEAAEAAPQVARRAQEELTVLTGGGGFGRRAEFLAQGFVGEATHPGALFGMAVAGGVYTVGRNALLMRLLASPAGALTRGFGARALSGLGAFALEAPAFTATTRAWQAAAGRASPNSWGRDLASSYLVLGGLKFFGAAASAAARRAGAGAFSRALLPTAGAYWGIVAGHGLESAFGLTPARPWDQVLFDSLATLLQFQVGGRLVSSALGPRWGIWQREVQLRSESALRWPRSPRFFSPGSFAQSALTAAGTASGGTLRPFHILMSKASESSRPPQIPPAQGSSVRVVAEANAFERLQSLIQLQSRRQRSGEAAPLLALLEEAVQQGRISESAVTEMRWAVHTYLIYQNSELLRTRVRESDLLSQEALVRRLAELREPVRAQLSNKRPYSLATLVQALAYGGRIPYERMRSFLSSAAAYDFFQQHSSLQNLPKSAFRDPYRLVQILRGQRRAIEASAGRRYKLNTLIEGLRWHPHFPSSQAQQFSMVAGSSDFVGALSRHRLRLDVAQLCELTMEQIYLRLLHLKPVLRSPSGEMVGIGYVLMGLRSHGLNQVKRGRVNDTAVQNAHALDMAYARWGDWGRHFGNLASIPRWGEGEGALVGWRRPAYFRAHLLKENGQSYSDSYLETLTRWGEFLWEHREALGLPEPKSVVLAELPASRGMALREFLTPYWDRLRELGPEDFLRSMLELRRRFREGQDRSAVAEEGRESPPLAQMVAAFYKSQNREAPGSMLTYAHQVDAILRRWWEWSGHFRRISDLPARRSRGLSRSEYAMDHLKRENGENFSKSTLNNIVRWGLWLWEHRGSLGLSRGSTMPPPPEGGE